MKALLTFSLSAILLFSNFVCRPIDMRKSMVHFDQAFLPVLKYSYNGDMYQAKRAIFYLDFQWQKMRNQFEFAKSDNEWRYAFRNIGERLGDAYAAIDNNSADLAVAQLELVKDEFVALREHYHIDYYLDYLYDFQASADELNEAASDEMLCLLEWEDVEQMAKVVNEAWRDAQYQPIDMELYELNAEKLALLKAKMKAVTAAVNNLNKAVDGANRADVAKACKKLEPTFLEALWVFSNFDASATYYAAQNNKNTSYSPIQN